MASNNQRPVFQVLDSHEAPHGGIHIRLRLERGEPPTIRALKGAEMTATSPGGEQRRLKIDGFAVFGGKPSNQRLLRTGRVDVHAVPLEGEVLPALTPDWELSGPN